MSSKNSVADHIRLIDLPSFSYMSRPGEHGRERDGPKALPLPLQKEIGAILKNFVPYEPTFPQGMTVQFSPAVFYLQVRDDSGNILECWDLNDACSLLSDPRSKYWKLHDAKTVKRLSKIMHGFHGTIPQKELIEEELRKARIELVDPK